MALKFAVNNSLSAVTSLPTAIPTGSMTLLQTQTASSSSSLEFSMDSTYDSYVFKLINCHPATNNSRFQFNGSTDSGSNYNVTKTTTYFNAYHDEADTFTALNYETARDLAQSTSFQDLGYSDSNNDDASLSGTLTIFNPSSSVFVKHFVSVNNVMHSQPMPLNNYIAGYFNTTSAITNLKFQYSTGNIDDGIIKMYGVK